MINVKDLHYAYPGAPAEAVRGLNFNIEPGEIFGFLGPSGAGKSTTQKIIIGILRGYAGAAIVNGTEAGKAGPEFYEHIGVSFEFPNLFGKLTGIENLRFFASLYSGRTENPSELMKRVGLYDDRDVRVANYSKGMKMRLNFCRSLLNMPDLLFLDEPTSGLDPVNARIIKDIILEKKASGKTVFLTTHNMTDADELCDRVAFIVDGTISAADSPRELKIKYGRKTVRVEYRNNSTVKSEEFDFDGIGGNKKFLDILKNEKIETIHSQEASLADIFIKLTGRELGAVPGEAS
ncbi:MAG: ABC transporter ATP-binding protein [Spirochaetes bacterium GWF1_51_8]|nr:MAG: ABC transporter ATP-binding protein [Spirochaetes bacterium GWF1_51_8]